MSKASTIISIAAIALLLSSCGTQQRVIPFELEMEARRHQAKPMERLNSEIKVLVDAYAYCSGQFSKKEQLQRAEEAAQRLDQDPDNARNIRHQIRAQCMSPQDQVPTEAKE